MKVQKKQIFELLNATFPNYSGRTFSVAAKDHVYLRDLNWGGGTKSSYAACTIDGKVIGNSDTVSQRHPFENRLIEGEKIPVSVGIVIAEHSIFCGKDMGVQFYVHPENMGKLLSN